MKSKTNGKTIKTNMNYAILAAGEGSRLSNEGVKMPKPLVEICGESMIDRLIRIFMENGAENIYIITNDLTKLVQKHIQELADNGLPLRLIVKTTPSSMHSFYELSKVMSEGKFCLTTVDTMFREEEFARYIDAFKSRENGGLMAVTDYIDDEKPLYISTDESKNITGYFDSLGDFKGSEVSAGSECKYISGGIYCLDSGCFSILENCINEGKARMRNFQKELVSSGYPLKAYAFTKIIDVDHQGDIEKAESFVKVSDR